MKRVKEFCKNHKKELVVIGGVIVGAVVGAIIYKHLGTKSVDYAGKNVISWTPGNTFINLERVKEILDLNANNSEMFAIFREGPDPNAYACVLLSENVVVSK